MIAGIHHVTCICGTAQENLDFYAGVLGMRLVKRSVNQDVPDTYHLFYADAEGHPGTDLTFFPWPASPQWQHGTGVGVEVTLAIPDGSHDFWMMRFRANGVQAGPAEQRHGELSIPFTDPHGQRLALVETRDAREFTPWARSPVPADRQIVGLHSVRLLERELGPTRDLLTEVLGFAYATEDGCWHRFAVNGGGSGKHVDVKEAPEIPRGRWGVGGMHHVAWRVADEKKELEVRERLARARRRPTEVIDRFWFKSVYFLEPGGVLFEIATDGPGFTTDEKLEALGETLVLPPWLEPHRREIERQLPPLDAGAVSNR